MAVWTVRAGKHGEGEDTALNNNVVVIGWHELGDLSGIGSRRALEELCRKAYPDRPQAIQNWVTQIWSFVHKLKQGDIVILPLKKNWTLVSEED